jgi:hypothetical protein
MTNSPDKYQASPIVTDGLNLIKIIVAIFSLGTILLSLASLLFIHNPGGRWLLVGLYTWSGGLFIAYLIFRTKKRLRQYYGTLQK